MDTNRNVFEIEGLACSYPGKGIRGRNVVLRVEQLTIPMGEVTMILGMSGSGKSTLIETLGLMNHTLEQGRIIYHHPEGQIAITPAIWERPALLAGIRNRHFSFIFQHDFLMPYYTPEENMMIGRLIQGNVQETGEEAQELRSRCLSVGLDPGTIGTQMPPDLSVGQRQRLSFIRAAMKEYDVLFGDEPTGNLDEANAELLLDAVVESVRQWPGRSAILVSHNIPLSVAKAGCIIVLSHVKGDLYEACPGNRYLRQGAGWINGSGALYNHDMLEKKIRTIVRKNEQAG